MTNEAVPCEYQIIGEAALIAWATDIDKDSVPPLIVSLNTLAEPTENEAKIKCVILNFNGSINVDLYALRKLAVPLRALKKANIKVVAVELPAEAVQMVKSQGLDDLIQVVYKSEIRAATRTEEKHSSVPPPSEPKPAPLVASHFTAIGKAITSMFQAQYGVAATAREPKLYQSARTYYPGIAGKAAFKLNGITGTIALCFPTDVYLKSCQSLFKRTFTQIEPSLKDGIAELLNMGLGSARTSLGRQDVEFKVYVPKAIFPLEGAAPLTPLPNIVVTFECDFGQFDLEVGLDSTKADGS